MKRPIALCAAAALLAGCSALGFVYNKLDWFASWQVGKYVELKGPVESVFDSGFDALWQWHRETQLALYARDLREVADAAAAPLSPPQVEALLERANAHAERVVDEALPGAVRVFQALSDAQVADMLRRVAERRAERARDDAKTGDGERREEAEERARKNGKRWLGSLTPEQKRRIADWVAARRFDPELSQRYAEEWGAAFAGLLAARMQPDFAARLRALMLDPQVPSRAAVAALQLENQRAAVAALADLSGTLSPEQRAHLQRELRHLAQDLDALAAHRRSP